MNVYEEGAKKVWRAYKIYAATAFVSRKGFELVGMTPVDDSPVDVAERFSLRGESALEHQAKTAFLCSLFASEFHNYFGRAAYLAQNLPSVWPLMTALLCHDVGEVKTGDIPDDGNALHGTKDAAELEVFKDLVRSGFEKEDADLLVDYFQMFQSHDDFEGQAMYAIDKLEAVLTQIFLEQYEVYGAITAKPLPTEQDRYFMNLIGTPCAADCWAAHLKALINDFPMAIRDPVYAVLMIAVCDVRGEMFPWWDKDISLNQ